MPKKEINFGGAAPFKLGAMVELRIGAKMLILSEHNDHCFDQCLEIPLEFSEQDHVGTGSYQEKAGSQCQPRSWTVHVFRIKGSRKPRLYGVHYPTPSENHQGEQPRGRQSSGVWGADE